ncbi:FimV/HubP family polar landmark protein [Marinicella sp. W31]|uniref:FimV/HubP family polar landmark protein n=1 Tax=Marinicella sp. W31 TaxID=3023713 RepID=UPI0037580ECC
MKKLLMITVLLGLIVISRSTFSLGMGKIQVDSALDEQLEAYIELSLTDGEAYDEIEVKLASSDDYRKVGLDRSFVPSNIRVNKDEDLSIVRVTSVGPVSEPIISLLLEVNWQNGKLLREYTILLDPPVFSESTASTRSEINTSPVAEVQVTDEPAMAELTVEESPQVITSDSISNDSSDTVPVVNETREGDVVVSSGDTLWSIASRNNYSGMTNHQMMMALYNANPEAFLNNNINQLSKGARLRIPSRDEVDSINSGDAFAQFQQHQSSWTPASSQPISTIQQESYTAEVAEPASTLDYGVELVGGDDTESSAGSVDGAESNETGVIQLEEELNSKSSENAELSSRVNELEELVEQQQAALEIQDSDLAAVQNMGDSMEDEANNTVDEIVTDVETATDDAASQLDNLIDNMNNTDETSNDDVWGQDQEATTDEALAAVTDPVDSGNVENNTAVEQTASTEPTNVQPTNTGVRVQEQSFLDTALEWVKSNLLYVGIGLLGLLALLFVPKLLRSGADDDDGEGNFLDDIKAGRNRKNIDEAVDGVNEDVVDTKLNEPLLEEIEEDLEDLEDDLEELDSDVTKEHNYDPDSLLQEDDAEAITEAVEEVALEDDDEFDLDEFLNQDDDAEENPDDADTRLDLQPIEDVEDIADDLTEELEAIDSNIEDAFEGDDELDALDIDEEAIDEAVTESSQELDLDAGLEDLDDLDLDLDDFEDDSTIEEEIDLGTAEIDVSDSSGIEEEISLDMDDDLEQELADLNADDDGITLDGGDSDDAGMDFDDLMAGEDSVETKLDLAKAYMGMGENEGAMNLLEEVIEEGSDAQKAEAESLKKEMDS